MDTSGIFAIKYGLYFRSSAYLCTGRSPPFGCSDIFVIIYGIICGAQHIYGHLGICVIIYVINYGAQPTYALGEAHPSGARTYVSQIYVT